MDRHALLIGIDRYPELDDADLEGCLNDVALMRSALVDRFGFPEAHLEVLRDGEASREAILAALDRLAERAGEGDVVVLFYAGHGSRMADPRRAGRMLESLVAADSGRGKRPNRDVLDEEIDRWVQRVNVKTPHVHLVFDCCHSGSVTRDVFGARTREVPPDLRRGEEMFDGALPPPLAAELAGEGDEPPPGWLLGRRRAVLVAACRADEYACEHRHLDGGEVVRHGALTFFLGRELLRSAGRPTWRDLLERVSPALTARFDRQHPVLEGAVDRVVFAAEELRPARYLRVTRVAGETVELDGGAAHGVTAGSTWSVGPPGASAPSGGAGPRLEVESVAAATATARARGAEGGEAIAVGQRAFPEEVRLPGEPLAVSFAEGALEAGEEASAARRLVAHLPLLRWSEDAAAADVLVRRLAARGAAAPGDACPQLAELEADAWAAVGADGRLAARLRPVAAGGLTQLLGDLARVARYRGLLALDDPDPGNPLRHAVRFEILRRDDETGDLVPAASEGRILFAEGERAEMVIENRGSRPVRVSLVEFGADRRIALLLPAPGHPTHRPGEGGPELAPGASLRVAADYYRQHPDHGEAVADGLPLHLPEGFPWAAEPGDESDTGSLYLKLLVTTAPADFEFLEQESVRIAAPGGAGSGHPLEELARRWGAEGGRRSFRPARTGGSPETAWAAVTREIAVRRAG